MKTALVYLQTALFVNVPGNLYQDKLRERLKLSSTDLIYGAYSGYSQSYSADPSNLGGAWTASDDFQGESWVGITSSNTGKNQTAIAAPGGLYMSNDYGESWKKSTSAPEFPQGNTYYQAVATNSDGQYIAAAVSGGPIFLSSDYGVSWVNCTGAPVSDATRWYSIDMSASGQYIGAVIMGGYVYMSTNYGKTWNRGEFSSTTNPQIHAWLEDDWFDIAISASGRYIVVVSGGDTGAIYYSSDYGNFFDPALLPISIKDLNQQWVGVAMDDAGQNVTVINSLIRGGLFSSNDYGATFTQVLTAPNVSMLGKVATSGDGRRMAMYSYIDMSTAKNIYLSGDGGVTWNATSAPTLSWSDLALTELGTFIYAPAFGDAIYTYLPNCPAGMIHSGYDSEGNKVCVACPAGSYTDAFPAETCTECSSGTYSTSEGNNGESSCQDCVYPWTTSGSGQTDCPVLWLNAPLMLTFLLIGALAALLVLMFLFGNDNQFVVLLIMGFPAVDALTDLVYLMISRFYSLPIFILCVLFFMHPTPMFFYKLYKYRALPYSFRFIWWLGYSSSFSSIAVDALNPAASPEDGNNNSNNNNNATASITHTGDHIPYPTILGRRFSLLVSFEQHDNLYVVVLELLTWVMAIVCQALTLVVLPAFLVLWLMVGIFLQMTKTIAMANVWNLWFYVWTGYNYWQDTPGAVDTEDLNYGLLAQFCLETIPHIVLQSINNTLLGTWVSDPIAIFSLVTSIFMAAATIYKYLYHVGIRADPQDMKNIPLDRSVSLKIFCTNMEYQLLNAKLEPHSRNITIPTAEQLYYKDKKYALLAEEVGSGGGDGGGGLADSGGASGNASLTSSLVNPMVNPMVNPTSSGTTNEEDKVVYDSATFAPATTGFPQKQQYQNPTLAEQQQPQQLAQPSTQTSSNTSHFTPLPSSAVVTTATPYNPPSPTPATLSATAACPPELICPLTQRIMSDPVICADGYTYERAAIEQHFRSQQELLAQVGVTGADARFASPTTKERLESTALIPNRSLAALLTKFYASQQES